jgi:putative Mg2+ transporter-C (MgtC) family protein
MLILATDTSLDATTADQLLIFGLTALAALLGGLLGFEREVAQKSAGARTHMLLAGASALAVAVAQLLFVSEGGGGGGGDPARGLHAVLTGIGLLCAGSIIRRDSSVTGLTTAASLWFAASVGIAIGLQLYIVGIGATVIGLVVLRLVAMAEDRVVDVVDGDED